MATCRARHVQRTPGRLPGGRSAGSAILILAAATFRRHGLTEVVGIEQAYLFLTPILGAGAAGTFFAIALLASGPNSSFTGTLAGQVVVEGFTELRWPSWARRLLARFLAMVPAMVAVGAHGEEGATRLLVFSSACNFPSPSIPMCA